MRCPKCNSEDIEFIHVTKKYQAWYCYHCNRIFRKFFKKEAKE